MAAHARTDLDPVTPVARKTVILRLPVSSQPGSTSDAELVERVRAGDAEAFDELVERHLDAAYAAAFAVSASREDAEDACQDAFIAALKRLEQCRDGSRFRAWLLRIVRNRAHNIRRYRALRAVVSFVESSAQGFGSDPALDTERAESREHIMVALRRLSSRQREVVVLFDMEGWTHRDIAESLGISEGASRAALFKGRLELRRLLGDILGEQNNDER